MKGLTLLDDESLLSSLHALVRTDREATSRIVAHLAEVQERRLHAVRGHSSLFVYCLKELRFSEDEACRRIEAARLASRFPIVLQMLESGTVSLSVLGLLKHRITEENAYALFAGVASKSVRSAKEWLAAKFPQPDLPESVRKLPSTGIRAHAVVAELPMQRTTSVDDATPAAPTIVRAPEVDSARVRPPTQVLHPTSTPARLVQTPRPARVEPIAADRFSVKLSISRAVRDKLDLARDLSSHRLPSGKLEDLLELALDALLEKLERTKLGKVKKPRRLKATDKRAVPSSTRRMAVPRQSRREVVSRDGLRCTYVSPDGRRCDCRAFLEFDHIDPAALGGGTESDNMRLHCRTHNSLAAEQAFGRPFMERVVREKRHRREEAQRGICGEGTDAAPTSGTMNKDSSGTQVSKGP